MTVLESTGKISDIKTFEQTIIGFASSMALNGFMIGLAYINFYSVSRETKVRGGCLTYWLIFWGLTAIYATYFFVNSHNSQWIIYAETGIAFFQILSFIGIWLWKKWGVFGFYLFTLIGPIFSFFRTESVLQTFLSFVSGLSFVLILYLLVKPKWQFFE